MFELGWSALDREDLVLAWVLAMDLAERTDGLLRDFEDHWWDPADRSSEL